MYTVGDRAFPDPVVHCCSDVESIVSRGGGSSADLVFTVAPQNGSWTLKDVTKVALTQVVSCIPRTETGDVDLGLLRSLPVVDDLLVTRVNEALSAAGFRSSDATAIRCARTPERPWLYLSDVLQGPRRQELPLSCKAEESEDDERSSVDAERPLAHRSGGPLTIPEDAPRTLTDAFLRTAAMLPEFGIVHVLSEGETLQTYRELLGQALRVAGGLRGAGLELRTPIVLQVADLRDYFAAFWGSMLAGLIPVTVAAPPSYEADNASVRKLHNAWQLLQHPVVLASSDLIPGLTALAADGVLPGAQIQAVEDLLGAEPLNDLYDARPEDVAFYQLTAGSTGIPKCIQERHDSVVRHIHHSTRVNQYVPADVTLNWLPMDHVVPLLTFHLKDTYLGCTQVQVPSGDILTDPLRWLDLIDRYRVSRTWSPNFGYNLVAKALRGGSDRSWDLSCVRTFMNAGEQVTLPVVKAFLEAVAPFGVRAGAMQPAFGMAEVCTCMTYVTDFEPETAALAVAKNSLSSDLRIGGGGEVVHFVDNGPPAPGVEIRIADEQERTLREGVIGRFQIRGGVVTPGYLDNVVANDEAFVGDGWFNTGDLGFLWGGHLYLTGRTKEMIIINGANFYCYEIEDLVNEIPGVLPTYVGSAAVADPVTGTEALAVFFVPTASIAGSPAAVAEVVGTIRERLTSSFGIRPSVIVPLAADGFPKTTSGKIQREQLRERLAAGAYDSVLRDIDLRTRNPRTTLPHWFFELEWRPHSGAPVGASKGRIVVVDELSSLSDAAARAWSCPVVERDEALSEVCRALSSAGGSAIDLVYFPSYDGLSEDALAGRLIHMLQSLAAESGRSSKVRLFLCSIARQRVAGVGNLRAIGASFTGVAVAADRELPGVDCVVVDLHGRNTREDVENLTHELAQGRAGAVVAYRHGTRFERGLRQADLAPTREQSRLVSEGDLVLVTGGLGGVGIHLVRELISRYGARVLVIGRRSQKAVEPLLLPLGGSQTVRYAQADVTDAAAVDVAVGETEKEWATRLKCVVHAAGSFSERLVLEEDSEHVRSVLYAKTAGARIVGDLLRHRGSGTFVAVSSVNGTLGGVGAASYSGASSFLDAYAEELRLAGLNAHSVAYSAWAGTGMHAATASTDLLAARGLDSLDPDQAVLSTVIALECAPSSHVLVGLDPSAASVAHRLAEPCEPLDDLVVAYSRTIGTMSLPDLPWIEDRFGVPVRLSRVAVDSLPLSENGQVDSVRLAQMVSRPHSRYGRPPATEAERLLADVIERTLGLRPPGVEVRLFDLGADSLGVAVVLEELRRVFDIPLRRADLFANPTMANLAARCAGTIGDVEAPDDVKAPMLETDARGGTSEDFPLTPAQESLWYGWCSSPRSWSYTMPISLHIHGPLRPTVLQQALRDVVQRHESLRTVFRAIDGTPRQRVQSHLEPEVVVDTSAPASREALYDLVRAEEHWVFDLESGPLVRMRIIPVSSIEYVVTIAVHHIVFDGSSYRPFFTDLSRAYSARATGLAPNFNPLPARMREYVAWYQRVSSTEHVRNQLEYWVNQLWDTEPRGIVPDYSKDPGEPRSGRYFPLSLAPDVGTQLRAVSAELDVTPFTVIAAALAVALRHQSGTSEIRIGTIVSGRADPALMDMVGFFTNAVVLQASVDLECTFANLVIRTQRVVLEALSNDELSFGEVIGSLSRKRNSAWGNPLYQVALVLQKDPLRYLHFNGMHISRFREGYDIARGDLVVEYQENAGNYSGGIFVDLDRFTEYTAETLVTKISRALTVGLQDPYVSVQDVLAALESEELL